MLIHRLYSFIFNKRVLHIFLLVGILLLCSSWGFFGHKRINRYAVFTLPSNIMGFYKKHIDQITQQAVNPDKRRYTDSTEAVKHYIDIDHYGKTALRDIPQKWEDARKKWTADTLKKYGILPWHIQHMYQLLVNAFKRKDTTQIIRLSADLGHYVADAHVPLHTSENYDGQLTGQKGIHALWESRLPEMFAANYSHYVGKAHYIVNPLVDAWQIVGLSFASLDTVLRMEKHLSETFSSDEKYAIIKKGKKQVKGFSSSYAAAYHQLLNGMVERKMQSAMLAIGSYWYSAWVDAGQPNLYESNKKMSAIKQNTLDNEREPLLKMIGRAEGEED